MFGKVIKGEQSSIIMTQLFPCRYLFWSNESIYLCKDLYTNTIALFVKKQKIGNNANVLQ